jgi:hypothetical protein
VGIRQAILQDTGEARVGKAIRIAVLVAAVAIAAWLIYFMGSVVAWPYQIEYREGAPLVMTRLLLEGQNPFAPEHQPLAANNYGILYNLSVIPVAAVLGNTLLAHRAVTVLFLLLCALLVFRQAFAANRDAGIALVGAELVAAALAAIGGVGAFPGTMGTFFFLAALLIPLNRKLDRAGILISAALCVLAFYTKPYFVLAFGILASYLFLFVSKKQALWYAAAFTGMLIISAIVVRTVLPFYFVDTFISNLTQGELNVRGLVIAELKQLALDFYPGLIAAAAILVFSPAWVLLEPANGKEEAKPAFMDRPLISGSPDYFLYAFICSLLAFIFVLGLHTYNSMNALPYSYQLVVPPFLLWVIRKLRPGTWLGLVLIPLLAFNAAAFSNAWIGPGMLAQLRETASTWESLDTYIQPAELILNSPMITSEIMRYGRWPVDSGQTEFYFEIRDYPRMELLGPDYATIREHGEPYLRALRAGVREQIFNAVILTQYDASNTIIKLDESENGLAHHYRLEKTISLTMPLTRGIFTVSIWWPVPK